DGRPGGLGRRPRAPARAGPRRPPPPGRAGAGRAARGPGEGQRPRGPRMSAGAAPNAPTPAAVHATVLDDTTPEVTRSYAEALINAASNQGQVDEVLG